MAYAALVLSSSVLACTSSKLEFALCLRCVLRAIILTFQRLDLTHSARRRLIPAFYQWTDDFPGFGARRLGRAKSQAKVIIDRRPMATASAYWIVIQYDLLMASVEPLCDQQTYMESFDVDSTGDVPPMEISGGSERLVRCVFTEGEADIVVFTVVNVPS